MEPFLSLLVFIIGAAIVIWLTTWIVAQLPIGQVPKNLILALVGLLLLLYFLQQFGLVQIFGEV